MVERKALAAQEDMRPAIAEPRPHGADLPQAGSSHAKRGSSPLADDDQGLRPTEDQDHAR